MSLVTDYLDERGVAFEVVPHRRAFTSLQEARELGVAAEEVVKTVALRTEGKYALAVVPASRWVDLRLARHALEDGRSAGQRGRASGRLPWLRAGGVAAAGVAAGGAVAGRPRGAGP